jgi:hypothetical protein
MASDVKLSREGLEAALDRWLSYGLARAQYGDTQTLAAAARALLRLMEPASDEEVSEQCAGRYTIPTWSEGQSQGFAEGVEWAEARARRLANWQAEP